MRFNSPSTPAIPIPPSEPLGFLDIPFGRGPDKIVDTNNLRDPLDTDPPFNEISGARMVGYYGGRSGIPFDNVQDAIDYLAAGGIPIVPAQADTSGGIPVNTGVQRFLAVTTPGSGAVIGDLLYDSGVVDGNPMAIIPAKSGRTISVTNYLFGGVVALQPDQLYVWEVPPGAWQIPDTSAQEATILVTGAYNGSAPLLPFNTGTPGFRVIIVGPTPPLSGTVGQILYDNGSGVGPQTILPAREGRVISITDDINIPPVVGVAPSFPRDTAWLWDADAGAWVQIGANGFLAPNELYVDTDRIATGNVGREVGTLADAIALAETLYAPGVDVIIRFREGQNHVSAGVTFPVTRNWSLYMEAVAGGPGVDTSTVGRVRLLGPALSWGAPAALLPVTGVDRVIQFKGINLLGGLYQNTGWKVVCDEVIFAGFAHTIDENAGAGIRPEFACSDCGDDSAFFVLDNTLKIATVNTGGGVHADLFFDRCEFALENVAPKGSAPPWQIDHANLSLTTCVLQCAVDSVDTNGVIHSPGGVFNALMSQCVFNLLSTGGGTGQLFSTPTTLSFSQVEIDPLLVGVGTTWRLMSSPWVLAAQFGAPNVGRFQLPAQPPQLAGTIVPDETLNNANSGRAGSVTPRVLDGEGYAMAGGSHLYGIKSTVSGGPVERIDWFLPNFASAVADELPIVVNRVVRFRIAVEAKRTSGAFAAAGFTFEGFITNDAGVLTLQSGAVVTAFDTTAALVVTSSFSATGLRINVDSTAVAQNFDWRAIAQWVVL